MHPHSSQAISSPTHLLTWALLKLCYMLFSKMMVVLYITAKQDWLLSVFTQVFTQVEDKLR